MNVVQAGRLGRSKGNLKTDGIKPLDRSKIDLIGLTGHLQFVRQQMLAMLARAFALKDRALQYETLQPPTGLDSFNILSFLAANTQQQRASNTAREKLGRISPMPTRPIVFRIQGVPVAGLTGGRRIGLRSAPTPSSSSAWETNRR